jgi:hypothetical protein
MSSPVIDPAERQRLFNRQTFDNFEAAAPHRRIVTELLLEACGEVASPRISLLGAGNLNDVELLPLVARGADIVATDLDGEALRAGAARQGFADDSRVKLLAGVDLAPLLAGATAPLSDDELRRLAATIPSTETFGVSEGGGFDVVVSTCVLSQLIFGLIDTLTPAHPLFVESLVALRKAHLQLMLDLCQPGGQCVLVTDVVSTETVEGLGERQRDDLPGLMAILVAQRNFFTGMNPLALLGTLSGDPSVAPRLRDLRVVPPWLWKLGPRDYLVCGYTWYCK